ncbi:MAG TPA: PD-(D/E)XK nuclease family protein, partial [Solirubrobacteraceae bacterium]|nr:PD-(D/E)XK nuclease family protein [Solirubrobacteraceae bacterium]
EAGPSIGWLASAIAGELPSPLEQADPPVCDLAVGGGGGRGLVRCMINAPTTVGRVVILDSLAHPPIPADRAPGPDRAPASSPPAAPPHPEGPPAPRAPGEASPAGGLAALSYTSLSLLERCGYRYYLERVLGLGEDRSAARSSEGGLQARARGTLIHALLESLDFTRPAAPSPEAVASRARALGMEVDAGEREEVSRLIGAACEADLAVRVGAAEGVRREYPFAFSMGPGEPLVSGVIDLIAREPDGAIVVVDYKSDRLTADVDLAELVEREYGLQRLIYALSVLRDGAGQVEIVHWFLHRPHDPVGALYAAADRGRLEEVLRARLAVAGERGFQVSPDPYRGLCETCPGRGGLCSWGEQETMRERPNGAV